MLAVRIVARIPAALLLLLVACQYPKPADTEPGDESAEEQANNPPECGTADDTEVAGLITNNGTINRIANVDDKRCARKQRARQIELQSQSVDVQKRQLQIQEQHAAEQNDQKLLDQLKALCDDGNDKACKALDFATRKRGCCAWHQGARSCDEDQHVVCFDGHVSDCSC